MIAEEWAAELLRVIRADGQCLAQSFADAGYPLPYGVELVLPTGALVYLQTPVDSSQATRPPYGPPVPPMGPVELPSDGPTALADVERWIGRCLTSGSSPWIQTVGLFQDRRGPARCIPHGLSVRGHSGARMWIYFRHATPAGRDPRHMTTWRIQATV